MVGGWGDWPRYQLPARGALGECRLVDEFNTDPVNDNQELRGPFMDAVVAQLGCKRKRAFRLVRNGPISVSPFRLLLVSGPKA